MFKDRNSKFFGYAFPIENEEDIKVYLTNIKNKHHAARHFCYAWQLGVEKIRFRANDDGEPSHSAGMPIYGQIQSYGVTNILVVSVRYFGGTKLGVGGLINAYRTSAQMTLEISDIVEKTVDVQYAISFQYDLINKVMRIIKDKKLTILDQKQKEDCVYIISARKRDENEVVNAFKNLYRLTIKRLEN